MIEFYRKLNRRIFELNDYYIYIYLDPRKSGRYVYGLYEFDYEPLYVGKGKNGRWKDISGRSEYFKRIINKIKKLGLEPIIIKLKENLNEDNSFILESELINLIGRKDLYQGSLINFTNGGEGISGYNHTYETKRKQSEKKKGENHPMFGKRGNETPMFGKHHSEETKRKQSEKLRGRKRPEKLKGKYLGKNHPMFGKHCSEESNRKRSEKMKGENSPMFGIKGENHPRSTLTEKDVIEIWEDLNKGMLTQKEIGKKFGVSQLTISAIKTRKIWKHVKNI